MARAECWPESNCRLANRPTPTESSSFSPHSGARWSFRKAAARVRARLAGEIMMNVKQNMEPRYGRWASISVIGALLSLVPAFAYTGEELISEARAIALKAHPGKIT